MCVDQKRVPQKCKQKAKSGRPTQDGHRFNGIQEFGLLPATFLRVRIIKKLSKRIQNEKGRDSATYVRL